MTLTWLFGFGAVGAAAVGAALLRPQALSVRTALLHANAEGVFVDRWTQAWFDHVRWAPCNATESECALVLSRFGALRSRVRHTRREDTSRVDAARHLTF